MVAPKDSKSENYGLRPRKKRVYYGIQKKTSKPVKTLKPKAPHKECAKKLSFKDIVVDKNVISNVKRMIMLPLKFPELFDGTPQKGILFYGPPGTGKTHMARVIADECSKFRKTSLIVHNASDCASRWFGERSYFCGVFGAGDT